VTKFGDYYLYKARTWNKDFDFWKIFYFEIGILRIFFQFLFSLVIHKFFPSFEFSE